MTDRGWINSTAMTRLIDGLVEKCVKDYKIDHARAREKFVEKLSSSHKLKSAAEGETNPDKIARTRAFRDASADAKREIYYELRRYSRESEGKETAPLLNLSPGVDKETLNAAIKETLEGHVSSKERAGQMESMYAQIFAAAGVPKTILDAGCGVQPLAYPFDGEGKRTKKYVGLDKDKKAVAALSAYAAIRGDGRLVAKEWDIANGWNDALKAAGAEEFDLALLLKVVPVVKRQEPELLNILADIPAKTIVVTGSKIGMAKRTSIERREKAIIAKFIETSGWTVIAPIELDEETGWVARRG